MSALEEIIKGYLRAQGCDFYDVDGEAYVWHPELGGRRFRDAAKWLVGREHAAAARDLQGAPPT